MEPEDTNAENNTTTEVVEVAVAAPTTREKVETALLYELTNGVDGPVRMQAAALLIQYGFADEAAPVEAPKKRGRPKKVKK